MIDKRVDPIDTAEDFGIKVFFGDGLGPLCAFLGVPHAPERLGTLRNASEERTLPDDLATECRAFYRQTYQAVTALFPETVQYWRQERRA